VFQAVENLGRSGPVWGVVKGAVLAGALAFGGLVADAANATTIIIQEGTLVGSLNVVVSGINSNNPLKATAMQFDGYYDYNPSRNSDNEYFENMVAFCVDVYHNIKVGDYNPDLVYQDTVNVTTDSNFPNQKNLSQAQLDQIGRLVNYGTRVFYQAPKTTIAQQNARYDQLAAVQGAIWKVVSGKNVTASTGNNTVNANINSLILTFSDLNYRFNTTKAYQLGSVTTKVTFWTPKATSKQSGYGSKNAYQAFAVGSVPEPATWVMMIGGFGFAGAMLRRSRQRLVAVKVTTKH
jgi:hypothetical protein